MTDVIFLPADSLSGLVSFVGAFVGVGVGVAFIGWALGYAIYFIIDVLRY